MAVKPGKAGTMRGLRGPHPESRPLLRAKEGTAARPEQGCQHPTGPRWAAQESPGRAPPTRQARPLTFTFPVLRRPSCPPTSPKSATPKRGGRREDARVTRHYRFVALAPVSPWTRLQLVGPYYSLGVCGPPAERLGRRLSVLPHLPGVPSR